MEAIVKRAKKIFERVRTHRESEVTKRIMKEASLYLLTDELQEELLQKVYYPERLQLRPEDRLRMTSTGQVLEDVLFELARAVKAPYRVQGCRSLAASPFEIGHPLRALGICLDNSEGYIPFPLAEALYRSKQYELRSLYDQREEKASLESLLSEMHEGAFFVICEYSRLENNTFSSTPAHYTVQLEQSYKSDQKTQVYPLKNFPFYMDENFDYTRRALHFFSTSWRNKVPSALCVGSRDFSYARPAQDTVYQFFKVFPKKTSSLPGSGSPYRTANF